MTQKADGSPQIGSVVIIDGKTYVIVDVMPQLTPYRKKSQDTFVEGWTVGLKEMEA